MQKFVFLLLAASIALLGAIVPVGATSIPHRGNNAHRLARGLPPLPPARRSPTETAKRRGTSPVPALTGRLEVRLTADGTSLGHVSNDPTKGPIGLNSATDSNPVNPDLVVKFEGNTLLALAPAFSGSDFIGKFGTDILLSSNKNTVNFQNVDSGEDADIWARDSKTSKLFASWNNADSDETKVQATLIYDSEKNKLLFTANPEGLTDGSSSLKRVDLYLHI